MVLYDSKGNFVWESFDFPTDTVLVGQSLRLKGPNKLVSRLSQMETKNGTYSLVLEPNRFEMLYASRNWAKPMLYFYSTDYLMFGKRELDVLTFTSRPKTDDAFAYELMLENPDRGNRILSRPKYNSTFTYLRLEIDGGLRAYTFYDKVDYGAWEETFTLFPRDSGEECGAGCRRDVGNLGFVRTANVWPAHLQMGYWAGKVTSCRASDIK
ncbi:hypothetical protein OROGR_015292 [Orobanche gracilis]